ncbi:MAG: adenosylcobalamin-dependent ribonucleoside-diphosphate reductase [Candidatus Micrarchaeota archaeon]|nr:adenosylcobalamin-dependent ribonucleoside-diphosphate reductase [Candidatus Micrarchaeota archaeon]
MQKQKEIVIPMEKRTRELLDEMFEYKSKLRETGSEEWIATYEKVLYSIVERLEENKLEKDDNYLLDNDLAQNIYKKKYFLRNVRDEYIETRPEMLFARVSAFTAAVEKEKDAEQWALKFYNDMFEGYWMPGGRVMAGAGDLFRTKTLANCFVIKIEDDNLESIFKAASEAAKTYSYGGGVGIDITPLRPKDAIVHNAANFSSGASSFMELYSLTTGIIGQSGRRGALMLTIDIKHPDIFNFIDIKHKPNWTTNQIIDQMKFSGIYSDSQLDKAKKIVVENVQIRFGNISIKVNDEFMSSVVEQNTYGKDKILIYKKKEKGRIEEALHDPEESHYSLGIPSKEIEKYELVEKFDSIEQLNKYLEENYKTGVSENDFRNERQRDIFGDYVIELKDYDFDLAVRESGDFLLYFGSKKSGSTKKLVKARDIWNKFVESNYKNAEPGLMFWSKLSKYSPSNYIGAPIITTNPCGEVPLEDGGACNLGSLNLSRMVSDPYTDKAKIDWNLIGESIDHLVRFLDNITSWNSKMNPLEKQKKAAENTRRIGLGVMGIADMFNQLGVAYDSDEGLKNLEQVMKFICNRAYLYSSKIAKEKGSFNLFKYDDYSKNPFFKEALDSEVKESIKKNGLRNAGVLSIAPTGTISNIAVGFVLNNKRYLGVSGGIEPIFALYYTRRSESLDRSFKIFHPTVQAYIDMNGLAGSIEKAETDEALMNILPDYFFSTAHKLDPLKRVKIQGMAQRYIDHSISSTVNLPEDIEPEVISNIYIEAWKNGLKGITIYREGSRYPILSTATGKKSEFDEEKDKSFKIKMNGSEVVAKGDDIIMMPDGKLTTVYHAMKKGLMSG